MSFPTKYLLISGLDVRCSQTPDVVYPIIWETLRPSGKLSSGWLEAERGVYVLAPSMKVVILPLQWDSVDERAFEKEVVCLIKNNCTYPIYRFGSVRFISSLLVGK